MSPNESTATGPSARIKSTVKNQSTAKIIKIRPKLEKRQKQQEYQNILYTREPDEQH